MSAATFAAAAFVAAALSATAAAVASAAFAFSVVASAMATSVTSSMTSASVDELTVETFGDLLLGSLPDSKDLAAELECLVCHRMVEVHLDEEFADLKNLARNDVSCRIGQRNGLSDHHQVLAELSVNHESRGWQLDDP